MIEWYTELRWLHIGSVIASGSLFAARGTLAICGLDRIAMAAPLRYLSYGIDTVLLAAAVLLAGALHQYPFVHHWLTAKVLLLVLYIVLGSFALKRAPTRRARALFFMAAAATFLFIVSVAAAHHPLGILHTALS